MSCLPLKAKEEQTRDSRRDPIKFIDKTYRHRSGPRHIQTDSTCTASSHLRLTTRPDGTRSNSIKFQIESNSNWHKIKKQQIIKKMSKFQLLKLQRVLVIHTFFTTKSISRSFRWLSFHSNSGIIFNQIQIIHCQQSSGYIMSSLSTKYKSTSNQMKMK